MTADGQQAKGEGGNSEPQKRVGRRGNPCRADILVAAARALSNDTKDAAQRSKVQQWQLEPPPEVSERRLRIIAQALDKPGGLLAPLLPLNAEEKQWLMDTPCPEVLNMVHVKDVGGATKAARRAAAAAAARPLRSPFCVARWRQISTGELLEVPVPLSVFDKLGGAVWAKWRQRAWRGLYSLSCQLGEPQEPAGCRDGAGRPLWDDLQEENAALDKFPFCIPQKCRAQLLGLGTTERLKSTVLSKRTSGEVQAEVAKPPLKKLRQKLQQLEDNASKGTTQRAGKLLHIARTAPAAVAGGRGAEEAAEGASAEPAPAAGAGQAEGLRDASTAVALSGGRETLTWQASLQQQQHHSAQLSKGALEKLEQSRHGGDVAQQQQRQKQRAESPGRQRRELGGEARSGASQQHRPLPARGAGLGRRSKGGSVPKLSCSATQQPNSPVHRARPRAPQQQQEQQPQQPMPLAEDRVPPCQVATPARPSPTPGSCTSGSSAAEGSAESTPASIKLPRGQPTGASLPGLPAQRAAGVDARAVHQAQLALALCDGVPELLPGMDNVATCLATGSSWLAPGMPASHGPGHSRPDEDPGPCMPWHTSCSGSAETPRSSGAGATQWPSSSPTSTARHALHRCAAQQSAAWLSGEHTAAPGHLPAQCQPCSSEQVSTPCMAATLPGPAAAARAASVSATHAEQGFMLMSSPAPAWRAEYPVLLPPAAAQGLSPAVELAVSPPLPALPLVLAGEPDELMSNEEFLAVLDQLFG